MKLQAVSSLVVAALWLICLQPTAAFDADEFQSKVIVTAITYDDGFGAPLKTPGGIWSDPESGELYVTDAGNGRVIIFDRNLASKFSFSHYVVDPQTNLKVLGEPKAIAVNNAGEMLLIDGRTDILDLLDFRGRLVAQCRPNILLGDSTLKLRASFVTMDEHDRFCLLVTGDMTRVLIIDAQLNLVSQFGEKGDLPRQFDAPTAVFVNDGKIYVGDLRGKPAVKIFDSAGTFLTGFGGHDVDRKDLTFPVGFGVLDLGDDGKYILVADALRQVIKVFTLEGDFFTSIGGIGVAPGLLQYPSGFASDGATALYVAERVGNRIQRYEIK